LSQRISELISISVPTSIPISLPQEEPVLSLTIDETSPSSTSAPPTLDVIPSLFLIRKFFEFFPLRVTDISIPLLKQKVSQFFHPSSIERLVNENTNKDHSHTKSAEDIPSGKDVETIREMLFPLSFDEETMKANELRVKRLSLIIRSWNEAQWLESHPSAPILSVQETPEGPLLLLNPLFICQFISHLYDWREKEASSSPSPIPSASLPLTSPHPLEPAAYLQFLNLTSLDSPSFLIVLYLFHVNIAQQQSLSPLVPPPHMEFIDWLNSLLPHPNLDHERQLFQVETTDMKINNVLVPIELYSFLSEAMNGMIGWFC
jgi:hypothetical protein